MGFPIAITEQEPTPTPWPAAVLLTPDLPLPSGSGRAMRAWGWLTELALEYRVHVLVAGPLPLGWTHPAGYPAASVRSLSGLVRLPSRPERMAGALFPPLALLSHRFVLDWQISRFEEPELAADAGQVQRIVVFRVYLHDVAKSLFTRHPDATRILDMDDVESQTRLSIARALLRAGKFKRAVAQLAAAAAYLLIEGRLCKGYAKTYLASPDDAARLDRRTGGPVACRPNRVRLPDDPAHRRSGGALSLLFVGSLDYFPNEEAARLLATQLAPILHKQLGLSWTITIAGRRAPQALSTLLRRSPGIRYVPDAEDLSALYAAAHIVLVPLRSGGGTKVKMLEALAHRRPVISTREGVRGLAVTPSQHYFAAETPIECAAVISRIVSGELDGERVAEDGWRLCRQLYSQSDERIDGTPA